MALSIQTRFGQYDFQGPYTDNDQLSASSGVYIITTLNGNGHHTVLDIGESNNIRDRISSHDRTEQWRSNIISGIYAWVLHCDERMRMSLEAEARLAYNPICGVR